MPSYLIDKILPTSRIHLLGGNSNAGKTRFLLPAMLAWQDGQPLMGFESHPVPWAYVIGDRLQVEAEDTMNTMGIDPKRVNMIPAFGNKNKGWLDVMREAERQKLGFLVWEGFGDFCIGERKREVRNFLSEISSYCHEKAFHGGSLTILGVMESPKLKPAEKYADPRQRISGIASWGFHTSSVFVIEAANPQQISSPERIMYASIKNDESFQTLGRFTNQGRLIFQPPPENGNSTPVTMKLP